MFDNWISRFVQTYYSKRGSGRIADAVECYAELTFNQNKPSLAGGSFHSNLPASIGVHSRLMVKSEELFSCSTIFEWLMITLPQASFLIHKPWRRGAPIP
jgi:hypothetical protein